jgi:hypothetical protein
MARVSSKKKKVMVRCLDCKFATLTRRRTNPVIAICDKREDVSPLTWTLEKVREIAHLDRECSMYEHDPNEKQVNQVD